MKRALTALACLTCTVAFLLGDGRYGIFEILKHVTPGIICDLTVPLLVRGGRQPGPVVWTAERDREMWAALQG